jgi:signal transduction histidine kinase
MPQASPLSPPAMTALRGSSVWSLLFDQLPHPACILRKGTILDANRAMQQMLNDDISELTGRSLREVLPSLPSEKILERMAQGKEGGLSCTIPLKSNAMLYTCKWTAFRTIRNAYFLVLEPSVSMTPTVLENDLYEDLQQQRNLIELMIETDELERKKFSDFLHDEIGSLLATAKHQLDIAAQTIKSDVSISQHELDKSIGLVDESIRQLRRLAMQTAPVSIEFGLSRAVRYWIESLQKKTSAHVQLILLPEEMKLPRSLEVVVYRIVQELLNNSINHSGASEIILQIVQHANSVNIILEDNGKGFDAKKEKRKKGTVGLKKIMQRVELFDGKLQIDSSPGRGSVVTIDLATS